MVSSFQQAVVLPLREWQMPIAPENYDQRSLTNEEYRALEQTCQTITSAWGLKNPGSSVSIQARKTLARLDLPVADVFQLRHHGKCARITLAVQRIVHREIYRHGKAFWDWSEAEWRDTLCPTVTAFGTRYHTYAWACRPSIMDAAYLLGGVSDLRSVGIGLTVSEAANVYFGKDFISQQCQKVLDELIGKGFTDSPATARTLRQCLSMLFILNRSPYLEDISQELLESVSMQSDYLRQACRRVAIGLQKFHAFAVPSIGRPQGPSPFTHTSQPP